MRRLFIYLKESIKANTSWVIFESNDESLWARVDGTIRVFLIDLWRDETSFVNVRRLTMTQDDILNGRVIAVASVMLGEFIIFRITKK